MAIIDKDTRMTVATRLANLNYKEQMDSSLAKLNELFEKYIIGKTPDDVLKCFKAHKKFFIRCNEPSLSSYNLPKTFFPEDWGSRGFYIHLKFTQELPIADEKVENIAKKLSEDHPIVQQIKEHLLLERDRYFMEKRPCHLLQHLYQLLPQHYPRHRRLQLLMLKVLSFQQFQVK